jgi:CheY-like chemotaxis protein
MTSILVIDDDPTIQMLLVQFLTGKGHNVLQAENGKIGMKLMEQHTPDLIITDILMPEMDGLEILMAIRKIDAAVPIIAISGGSRQLQIDFLRQAKLFGARYVFEKPVPLNVLYKAVTDLIGE